MNFAPRCASSGSVDARTMRRQSHNLYAAGISHECAKAQLVGQCALTPQKCTETESRLLGLSGISEILILSTCNRFETYFVADSEKYAEEILSEFAHMGKPAGELREHSYFFSNGDALQHLFEVASGLKSQMVGETEILGQVKAAYARAAAAGHCRAILNSTFQKAAQCAKWIRTNTDIGHGKISLGSVSAELASRIFEDISKAKILLVGSGEAGKLVADALFVRGARNITVASRTWANSNELAKKIGATAEHLQNVLSSISDFDIVICASRSPQYLITLDLARDAIRARAGNPVFFIDLAVPKNIDPYCGDLDNVFLYNLDDLSKIANENILARMGEINRARVEIGRRSSLISQRLFLSSMP